jgi:hypothetical protein
MLCATLGGFLDPAPTALNRLQTGGFQVTSKLRVFSPPLQQSLFSDVTRFGGEMERKAHPGNFYDPGHSCSVFFGGRPRPCEAGTAMNRRNIFATA